MTVSLHNDSDYETLAVREGELWGEAKEGKRLSWFDSPLIGRYINRCISGRSGRDWLDYVKKVCFSESAPLGLNVGCGQGELERLIIKRGLVQRMDGFDISAKAVDLAGKNAERDGLSDRIRYIKADANYLEEAELEKEYDAVFASMALHHIVHLERCLDALRERLKAGGYLIANEYIGPDRFQWSNEQLEAVNRLLKCFPSELKRNLRVPGRLKQSVYRPLLEYMKEHLAFEAICSERIVPALSERFEIVERKNYGGTVLHLLFEAIVGNFDEEMNREHAVIVRMAIAYEKSLLDSGVLNHDHALLICRKT